ncbi:hypothetical protein EVAR_44736_1 [Eumeta japonica]|uniref:Uncharacterized protein n=1 Tax=Eumeta variegata TaxID=151549 RepID=A0A4C1XJP4_EUMVA|nr:hypothetical protein EVAR_44736_1 [Eumeta japonica]
MSTTVCQSSRDNRRKKVYLLIGILAALLPCQVLDRFAAETYSPPMFLAADRRPCAPKADGAHSAGRELLVTVCHQRDDNIPDRMLSARSP